MDEKKPLPIGVENFEDFYTDDYYYVDKTGFIRELLDKKAKVNLFTRPRRFGKTLTLSMLKYFFEDAYDFRGNKKDNRHLFDGLKIMDAGEKYTRHMGQYPVISLTLKSGKQATFGSAMKQLCEMIAMEFKRHKYVLLDNVLSESDKKKYEMYMDIQAEMDDYKSALWFLCICLEQWYDKKVIVLIDEYDVPLESSYFNGYYDEMVDFIRALFESTLKTNDSLYFAVITGCLRISRESIFTGLNNLRINSILSTNYGEYFGFTEEEAEKMCSDYGIPDKYAELKDWYNGYVFGKANVYNPWSSIQYIYDRMEDLDGYPVPYWANTSSNSIVRTLIDRADRDVKDEIENLIAGGTVEKAIHEDITYGEVYDSMENLWNFMFFTGYFKKVGERFQDRVLYATLKIPNQEVLYIFENKIRIWFEQKLKERNPNKLFEAVQKKDTEAMAAEIRNMLYTSISFYDYYENFYHGFLAGILYGMEYYVVKSNRESGKGRTDLYLKPARFSMPAYIFEFKCVKNIDDATQAAKEA